MKVFFTIFLRFFLLGILLFSSGAFSCLQAFRTAKDDLLNAKGKSVSARDVFLSFAKEHLGGELAQKMGNKWPEQIARSVTNWTPEEAKQFLQFLRNRIGEQDTIKRIKPSSYFSYMNYEAFIERVAFYDQYMGEQKMTIRLRKSLRGLDRGKVEEIRQVADFLKSYIGKEKTIQMMEQNLQVFSGAKFNRLKDMAKLIKSYLGKKELIQRMNNAEDLRILSNNKPEELKPFLEYMENKFGGGAEGKQRIKRVLQTGFREILTTRPLSPL